ncbi:putative aminotransferase [Mycobacteroides abscessus subsp. abscessus]|nr:putative aminotransferase [Mycobacteroides abscessus subsp. abscessus]
MEAAITSRTVAVLPVHLYGAFADIHALTEVTSRHGIPVVEDGCQGIGLDGLGHHSDAAILSFNPYKNLGAVGKAGAVATRLPGLARRVTELLYHGLRAAGVATDLYYPVLTHRQRVPLVADLFEGVRLPRTEAAHARMFQLPLYPALTLAEQDRVIGALHDVLG